MSTKTYVGQVAMATDHGGKLGMRGDNSSQPIGGRVGGRLRNEEEAHGEVWKGQECNDLARGPYRKSMNGEHGVLLEQFQNIA